MVDKLAEGDYEIIIIKNDNNSKRGPKTWDWLLTVDLAKKLHKFMGVKTGFTIWIERMLTYGGPVGFTEGVDYQILHNKNVKQVHGGHNKLDYMITMDMTQEIAMLQRTDKGWEVRDYFLQCEKTLENLDPFDSS